MTPVDGCGWINDVAAEKLSQNPIAEKKKL
jgi:hypothetical protein